ncbi:MAG TPA: hypothetical protein VL944_02780 [Candidatus Acidoferrum sp.]|nr:hypothetical protein [Candidatus Acidoferrum sp.]
MVATSVRAQFDESISLAERVRLQQLELLPTREAALYKLERDPNGDIEGRRLTRQHIGAAYSKLLEGTDEEQLRWFEASRKGTGIFGPHSARKLLPEIFPGVADEEVRAVEGMVAAARGIQMVPIVGDIGIMPRISGPEEKKDLAVANQRAAEAIRGLLTRIIQINSSATPESPIEKRG